MPQLLAMALVGAGLWAGYRWFRNETRRVREELERAEGEMRRHDQQGARVMPSLERDPETGVYRPSGPDRTEG